MHGWIRDPLQYHCIYELRIVQGSSSSKSGLASKSLCGEASHVPHSFPAHSLEKLMFKNAPTPQEFREGEDAVIVCDVVSSLPPTIIWKHKGRDVILKKDGKTQVPWQPPAAPGLLCSWELHFTSLWEIPGQTQGQVSQKAPSVLQVLSGWVALAGGLDSWSPLQSRRHISNRLLLGAIFQSWEHIFLYQPQVPFSKTVVRTKRHSYLSADARVLWLILGEPASCLFQFDS